MMDKSQLEDMMQKLVLARKQYANTPVDGERITILREGKLDISVIVYKPKEIKGTLPVLVELHGGAWLAGDAVSMNSFCSYMAEAIPAVVVNLNYKKIDEHPFPYQQDEVCDTVRWIIDHATDLNIDPSKITICGQSAGAHICAGAAILMKEEGIPLNSQILIYPFTDFTFEYETENGREMSDMALLLHREFFPDLEVTNSIVSPLLACDDTLSGVAPATIIVCGKDALLPHGIKYAERLKILGVETQIKEYPTAEHGFLEINRPEQQEHELNNEEQGKLARDCEQYLIEILRGNFKK